MKEAYVSFEVAKLLKENGFDWDCARYYNAQHGEARIVGDTFICNWNDESLMERLMMSGAYSIPTQQMACRWLRDKQIDILPDCSLVDRKYSFHIINRYKSGGEIIHSDEMYDKYEDAIEAALEYCLTNLI